MALLIRRNRQSGFGIRPAG